MGNQQAVGETVTMPRDGFAAGMLIRLAAGSTVGAAVLGLAGWVPTQRIAGGAGLTAMAVGIGVSWIASIAAAVLLASGRRQSPAERVTATLGAMAVRMFVTLLLFAAVALGTPVARGPLGLWTGLAYVCLLAIEVGLFIRLAGSRQDGASGDNRP